MRKYQRGVTALGWLILLTPMAILFYVGVRLLPVYLNYMNVAQSLTQVSTEVPGSSADVEAIRLSLEKHFDVAGVTFPTAKDIKITRANNSWTVEANYDDQTPLFANVFILVSFDKTVQLKGGSGF